MTCPRWVHCCANIDWSLLTDSDIDVINFDAYMHWDKVSLYSIDLFVKQGIDEELLAASSWVLQSCETVLLTPDQSDLAFSMTHEISHIMKRKHGFES